MQPSAARRVFALTALLLAACAPVEEKAPAPVAANEKPATMSDDAYLWLEDIHGEKPLAWVRAENERTAKAYAQTPQFETMRSRILEVLDSDAKIPFVAKIGERYYNFWKDKTHPRGLLSLIHI